MLAHLYSPSGPERCGYIVNGKVVEVQNCHADPEHGFLVKAEDIVKYADSASATWHTHPGQDANLSTDDFIAFLNWPKLKHYVVGADGVRCFVVEKGSLVEAQD